MTDGPEEECGRSREAESVVEGARGGGGGKVGIREGRRGIATKGYK